MLKSGQMKKIAFLFSVAAMVTACGNDNTTEAENPGTRATPVAPGVDNVQGNIPDTTGGIRLNRTLPVDSVTGSATDTVPRR
jgi:hypothetical protein